MSRHSEHVEQLVTALTEQMDPLPPSIARLVEECDDCRREVADLQEMGALLDRAGEDEHAVVDEARRLLQTPGAVPPAAHPFRPAGTVRRGPRLLVAAALVIFIGFVASTTFWSSPDGAFTPVELLSGDFDVLEPGATGSFRTFRWEEVEGGVVYVVKVYDGRQHPDQAELLLTSEPTDLPQWTPTDLQFDRMPERIHVRVEARRPGGGELVARSHWRTSERETSSGD